MLFRETHNTLFEQNARYWMLKQVVLIVTYMLQSVKRCKVWFAPGKNPVKFSIHPPPPPHSKDKERDSEWNSDMHILSLLLQSMNEIW
jgi:hypothetical protein